MRKLFLAIDLGGTSAKCGIFNQQKQLLQEFTILTKASFETNSDLTISNLFSQVETKTNKFNEIVAVGVTVPGKFNRHQQIVELAPNLNWVNYPILTKIQQNLEQIPVYVLNDADAAGYYELKMNKYQNQIVYTLGTGVGGAAIKDSHLLLDANTEFGHYDNYHADANHKCQVDLGCLDIICSAKAINEKIKSTVKQNRLSTCFSYLKDSAINELSTKDLAKWLHHQPMNQAEPMSYINERYHIATEILVNAFIPLVKHIIKKTNEFSSEIVIIAGGAALIGEPMIAILNQLISEYEPTFCRNTKIKISDAKNKSGLFGIFNYAYDQYQQNIHAETTKFAQNHQVLSFTYPKVSNSVHDFVSLNETENNQIIKYHQGTNQKSANQLGISDKAIFNTGKIEKNGNKSFLISQQTENEKLTDNSVQSNSFN